jgi:formylglycine-generating enzyme required for sulfatase activity
MCLRESRALLALSILIACTTPALAERNSTGMEMVSIPSGKFAMGAAKEQGGEWDEAPVREVSISRALLMSATEVTNAQYEQFDPRHRALRGKRGLSKDDDEAVVFVTWHDAQRYCAWLSQKEGKPYRLPTEAEWEYACRAGTATKYHTGDELPKEFQKNAREEWDPKPIPLHVGKTAANAWGLYDMHGNVEEWCLDWYGSRSDERRVGKEGDRRSRRGW